MDYADQIRSYGREKRMIQSAVDVLNEALKLDKEAVNKLYRNDVTCCLDLADHPNIVVVGTEDGGKYKLSVLGLLNGVLDRLLGEKICAVVDEDTGEILRFEVYTAPDPCFKNPT